MRSRRTLAICAAGLLLVLLAMLWLLRTDEDSPPLSMPHAQELESPPVAVDLPPVHSRAAQAAPPMVPRPSAVDEAPVPQALPIAAESSLGSVHGRVLDDEGVGVAFVSVNLFSGHERRGGHTNAAGKFAFGDLSPGLYRLHVDGRSLGAGLLPPVQQQLSREYEGHATGIGGTVFRVADANPVEIDLRVFAAGVVRGRVVDSAGRSLHAVSVEIRSESMGMWQTVTGAQGAFEFSPAYPGRYSACAPVAFESGFDEAANPLPITFDVAARQTVVLPDLQAGSGGHVLQGLVVDAGGHPLPAIGVTCREVGNPAVWQTWTRPDGHYEIGRVPSARLVLAIGSNDAWLISSGSDIASGPIEIQVDTQGAPDTVDVGATTMQVSGLFAVTGDIKVDTNWANILEFQWWNSRVDVRPADESTGTSVARLLTSPRIIRLPSTSFLWQCDTPHPDVVLTVVLQEPDGTEHEHAETIRPEADQKRKIEVNFP